MYKHILVATDGSKLSLKAVKTAARLAADLGANLSAIYVMPI
jgi:nucleotide-binding universal stress UspA family protein